jgi:hypothetical protein
MGRTVPSFRYALEEEKAEWKVFRKALDKSERKEFDEMWDIPRLYITACSNSVSLVPLHPIAMSILFHHYKELMECSKRLNRMMNSNAKVEEEEEEEEKGVEEIGLHQKRQQLKLSDF